MVLEDVCELIADCPHTTAPDEGKGYPLIRTPNVGKGRLLLEGVHRVSKDIYDKRNMRAIPQKDDIIFAREAPAGNAALIREGQEVCLGQRTVLIRPDCEKVFPKYLVYYLLAPEQQYKLLGTANGATVAHVNLPVIRKMPIELPDIDVQQKIAGYISIYDDLIENNQKQIKLLEEAAQRLYKEWFIDLRFPGYENCKIVDGVPEGWEIVSISDVADLKAGGDKPKDFANTLTNECTIPVFANGITDKGLMGFTNKPTITKPSVTISARGTVGVVFLRREPFMPIVRLISVTPNEEKMDVFYLYLYLANQSFRSTGAAQQQITVPLLKNKTIMCPDEGVRKTFEMYTKTIFDKIQGLEKQTMKLIEARDRLLPKLMSGEIEV